MPPFLYTLYIGGEQTATTPHNNKTLTGRAARQKGNTMEKTNKQNAQTLNTFDELKRQYEQTTASGKDNTAELYALAKAVAYSVVNKCLDPQHNTAADREQVSNNGFTPSLLAVKRGIAADVATLNNTRRVSDLALHTEYTADGELVTVEDKTLATAWDKLTHDTLTDGIDLVQTAALAILEQTAAAAADVTAAAWLDNEMTVRELSRRVYIRAEDSAAYRDRVTTPIQEVYREVRRAVQNSRAVQTDPRNGYTYIEDMTADPDTGKLETIYRRMGKHADIGGYDVHGTYTADKQTAADFDNVLAALNLTERQAAVVRLRMQGYGTPAIGTYFGITHNAVINILHKVQKKAAAVGFTPSMWQEMTAAE